MQPGFEAFGFISCTGTNMLLRGRALQQAGWLPTDTVTEDWELGMHLKSLGWRCAYVQEYLATGEAPEEVRDVV
jgi:cellulose synthase/poly-beta-1,6-N-acetylglucosamine synthase-like glycosyltransferase